jgi:hypothetical protein
MAQAIGEAAHRLPEEPLTAFLAMRGRAYDGALMWVGRAVNGWVKPGCTPAELRDAARADALVQAVLDKAVGESEGPCPLRWVADQWGSRTASYNTARSAFWRTARRILLAAGDAGATEGAWPSRLVWSNLYKFAPEKGWNPSEAVAALQRARCRELLLHEIATFRPRRFVLAMGMNWARPFLDAPCFALDQRPGTKPVEAGGRLVLDGETVGRFVVASHPMGKKEDHWTQAVREGLEN